MPTAAAAAGAARARAGADHRAVANFLYAAIGEPRVGDRRLAAQGVRGRGADHGEPRSTSVSIRLTKNEATELIAEQVTSLALLQARHEGIDDLPVALQREDQRHVHADPVAQALRYRGQALGAWPGS